MKVVEARKGKRRDPQWEGVQTSVSMHAHEFTRTCAEVYATTYIYIWRGGRTIYKGEGTHERDT